MLTYFKYAALYRSFPPELGRIFLSTLYTPVFTRYMTKLASVFREVYWNLRLKSGHNSQRYME